MGNILSRGWDRATAPVHRGERTGSHDEKQKPAAVPNRAPQQLLSSRLEWPHPARGMRPERSPRVPRRFANRVCRVDPRTPFDEEAIAAECSPTRRWRNPVVQKPLHPSGKAVDVAPIAGSPRPPAGNLTDSAQENCRRLTTSATKLLSQDLSNRICSRDGQSASTMLAHIQRRVT